MRTTRIRSAVWFATGAVLALIVPLLVLQAWRVDADPGDKDATFEPITACRLIDTRPAPDRVGPHGTLSQADTTTIQARGVNGKCTIPSRATALVMNVTALNATAGTFLTFWPGGTMPLAASLTPTAGEPAVPNAVTVPLSATGAFNVYNNLGSVDIVIDVNGFYTKASLQQLDQELATHTHDYPVGKVQTVLQLGQHSTPSMTYVNVPGASLTAVTSANGRLLTTFSSQVLCKDNAPGGGLPWCLVQVLVDGTPIQPDRVIFAAGDPDGNAWNSRSHQFVSDPLAAGPHTVQARYRVDDAAAVFNLDQTVMTVLPLAP